jgi:hypothetical protein
MNRVLSFLFLILLMSKSNHITPYVIKFNTKARQRRPEYPLMGFQVSCAFQSNPLFLLNCRRPRMVSPVIHGLLKIA